MEGELWLWRACTSFAQMSACLAFCSLWVPLQEFQNKFSTPGKEPSSLNHRGQWKDWESIIHDAQWGRKWLYLWGTGPLIRGSMSGGISFLVVGRRQTRLPSAPPMPRGLKKKKQKLCHPAGRTWHVTDLHTFCQVLCSQTCSSSPCCWGCIFSFLHLVCWDGTEKGYCSVMPAPQRAGDSDGVSSYPWLRCLWVSIWDTVRLHPAEQGNTLQLASDLENVHNALLSENSSI